MQKLTETVIIENNSIKIKMTSRKEKKKA